MLIFKESESSNSVFCTWHDPFTSRTLFLKMCFVFKETLLNKNADEEEANWTLKLVALVFWSRGAGEKHTFSTLFQDVSFAPYQDP